MIMKSEEELLELLKDSVKNYLNFYEVEKKINEVCKRLSIENQYTNSLMNVNKPILYPGHSSKDVEEYLEKLKRYEKLLEDKKKCEYTLSIIDSSRNLILMSKAEELSGLNDIVPSKYQKKVKEFAWEKGHSSGYSEYYNQLCSLVYIFEED